MTPLVSTRGNQGDHHARPVDTIAVARKAAKEQR